MLSGFQIPRIGISFVDCVGNCVGIENWQNVAGIVPKVGVSIVATEIGIVMILAQENAVGSGVKV